MFPLKKYEMIATGELQTIYISRGVRVSASALRKWVEERKLQEDVSASKAHTEDQHECKKCSNPCSNAGVIWRKITIESEQYEAF
jgi:hypothetical protein